MSYRDAASPSPLLSAEHLRKVYPDGKVVALEDVSLAIDLYRGKVADNPDLAHELMRGVPEDRGSRDLRAAFDYLTSQPNVKKDRIGSIGWCMGGGYSLRVAILEPTLAADVTPRHCCSPSRRRLDPALARSGGWRAGSASTRRRAALTTPCR